jgi:serine/threonine-protein kinase
MPSAPRETPTEADQAAVFDAYVEALHAGDLAAGARLKAEHPELAGVLDCLDALDEMAPKPERPWDAPTTTEPARPPADPAELPSAQFGKFDLLRELGKGGMGVVYLARQRDLGRLVALKLIRGSQLASTEQLERFQAEARMAAGLRHPNIVAVFEAGEVDGQHYIAMQYVEGRGLDDVLRSRPPSPEEAARILVQVVRAVAYLHGQGVIHRDLKPSNVLIDAEGHPYLTDFGLARLLDGDSRITQTGAILGTPSYMPPEQAGGRREADVRSDVYSLGAVLYEMLTGRPPYRAETALETLVQVVESEPTLPRRLKPRLPRELELICLKCLEKFPERRYQTATALADELDRYLRGDPVEARPRGPLQSLVRWTRREPALASRVITLTVFLAVIQVTYQMRPESDPLIHYLVVGLTVLWITASWVCQRLMSRPRLSERVLVLWAGGEPFLLTGLLALTGTGGGPLLVAFPVMVAGAGLWFRVRLVWVVTAAALLAFLLLVAISRELQEGLWLATVLFPVLLTACGVIVAQQVERVRVLSRHYEGRPLP